MARRFLLAGAGLALALLRSSDQHTRTLGRLLRRGDLRALYRALHNPKK